MLDKLIYKLKRPYHFFRTGLLEGELARLQSLQAVKDVTIIGITGTDGKTTTSTLLYELLTKANIKTGLISTVGGYIGNQVLNTGLHITAPGPKDLYRLLRLMKAQGCTHVVLETTSHGLYQYRFWGIKPTIAGITNITHEHLDYHQSWEAYAKAKLLLFQHAKSIYLNADDASYSFFQKQRWGRKQTVTRYSSATVLPKEVKKAIAERFPETYNRSNALLAFLIAREVGVTNQQAVSAISSFAGVPGRMELVAEKPIRIYVDFAHTPNALKQVLTALRAKMELPARLIVVFGCAGLRDTLKRPMMGEIASQLADLAIFTAEDPRTENIWSILRQMKGGVTQNHNKVVTIADRKEAIRFAIRHSAHRGDCVVVCGKGHEQSICIGTQEIPWNDADVIREILKEQK